MTQREGVVKQLIGSMIEWPNERSTGLLHLPQASAAITTSDITGHFGLFPVCNVYQLRRPAEIRSTTFIRSLLCSKCLGHTHNAHWDQICPPCMGCPGLSRHLYCKSMLCGPRWWW